jgi:hypothetical protein
MHIYLCMMVVMYASYVLYRLRLCTFCKKTLHLYIYVVYFLDLLHDTTLVGTRKTMHPNHSQLYYGSNLGTFR